MEATSHLGQEATRSRWVWERNNISVFQALGPQQSEPSTIATAKFSISAKTLDVSPYLMTDCLEIPGPGNYVAPSEFGIYESKHKSAMSEY